MSALSLIVKFLITISLIGFNQVDGHGRLLTPIARTSLWRIDSRLTPNYDDNQMFCGGFDTQYRKNNGKCGICGEDASGPKAYERGGRLYAGALVQTYTQSQVIDVVVELTANHAGFFQFRMCNIDGTRRDATQECLNRITLRDVDGNTKVQVPVNYTGRIPIRLQLPASLTCNHCVFQWKYNAGNSWGTDRSTGESCVGCGDQENFFGCSDVKILPRRSQNVNIRKFMELRGNADDDVVRLPKTLLSELVSELKRLKEVEKKYLAETGSFDTGASDQMERELYSAERRFAKAPTFSVGEFRRGDITGGVDDGVQTSQETSHDLAGREFKLKPYAMADDLETRGYITGGIDDGVQISQEASHGDPSFYRREFKLRPYALEAESLEARGYGADDLSEAGQISQESSHGPSFYRREFKLQPVSVDAEEMEARGFLDNGIDDGTQVSDETSHGPRFFRREFKLKSYALADEDQELGQRPKSSLFSRRYSHIRK